MPSLPTLPEIDIPPAWRSSAQAVLAHDWRKVLILGASDCGKSTYGDFLTGSLRAAGAAVAFVDADIGQKDVGPPATVSLARRGSEPRLAQAKPAALYFVGDVDPVGHLLPLIVGTRRMVDAASRGFVVIDTPGLIEGPGRVLHAYQIESLQPDVIVGIERERELEPTLRAYGHCRSLRLAPSPRAAARSDSARRRAREQAFRDYFADGRELALDPERLAVQRARALPDFADRLLCGVADAKGECCGLGIVEGIEAAGGGLRFYTPVPRAQIHGLQPGDLCLGRDGRELGRRRPRAG